MSETLHSAGGTPVQGNTYASSRRAFAGPAQYFYHEKRAPRWVRKLRRLQRRLKRYSRRFYNSLAPLLVPFVRCVTVALPKVLATFKPAALLSTPTPHPPSRCKRGRTQQGTPRGRRAGARLAFHESAAPGTPPARTSPPPSEIADLFARVHELEAALSKVKDVDATVASPAPTVPSSVSTAPLSAPAYSAPPPIVRPPPPPPPPPRSEASQAAPSCPSTRPKSSLHKDVVPPQSRPRAATVMSGSSGGGFFSDPRFAQLLSLQSSKLKSVDTNTVTPKEGGRSRACTTVGAFDADDIAAKLQARFKAPYPDENEGEEWED